MSQLFELLFKYKPIVYEKGRLGFQLLESRAWFLLVLIAAAAGSYFLYRLVAREHRPAALVAFRSVTLAVMAFIFLRPVLNISTVLPQESYFAVVIDNSESMKIKDEGKASRAEQLMAELDSAQFFKRLADKFRVRIYRFDRGAERIDRLDRLTFEGKRTRLEAPLEALYEELGTVPLSGIALITDGVDNASQRWTEALARIQSRRIPIYTVGVGSEAVTRDAELVKIAAPREMLKDSTAVVDVSFRSHGLSGRKATLYVRENGVLMKSEEVELPKDGEVGNKSVDLPVKNEGTRLFSFSIQSQDDRIAENNTLDTLIQVQNDHPQILYIEGEPRWEYRFLRRAIADDPNLRLVTLLRSSHNKFYRQGIDREEMLAEGFPARREDLFQYKGVVFGSIESTFFTQDQLNMVVEFVSQRGGGFMMIGGKNSFSGGRYQNTPIADILPVQLVQETRESSFILDRLRFLVSDYGKTHPLMKLSPDASASVKKWSELPPLNEFNKTLGAKVGAIVLAQGEPEKKGNGSPILLAYQRYGRGRVMVFTSSSSWRWQMEMDHADMTHELFWKQMMRWLVNASPDSVMISSDKDTYLPDEAVRLFSEVSDKKFARLNNARVIARVTDPEGNTKPVPLEWTGRQEGTYKAQVSAGAPGTYQVDVEAQQNTERIGTHRAAFQVQDRPIEYYNAALDKRFLESVASQSGGRYYPLSEIGNLPDDAVYVEGESSIVEQKELWDVPFLFLILCGTLAAEWFWRKKKGLA